MNPRKMLALLGPCSPSLKRLMHKAFGLSADEGGRSNATPVTAQDVAAALGFIQLDRPEDRALAMGVYCLLWFPNYDTRRRRFDAVEGLALRLGSEYQRRQQPGCRGRRGDHAPFPRFPVRRFPRPEMGLWAIATAVLDELQHKQDCEACEGFGMVPDFQPGGGWQAKACEDCEGRGYTEWSATRRAKAVQIRRHTFQVTLQRPYVWLLREARHLEQQAASGHYSALREDD